MAQSRADDIREEAGIPYMDFNAGDNKRLKADNARQRVPLHPRLIELGFCDFVEGKRKAGPGAKSLSGLRLDAHGSPIGLFSKWYNRYARQFVPASDSVRKDFHSFRHGFKDQLREAGAPEDVRDALAGHSYPSVGRGYGSGHSLKTLAEWVSKIEYPGVEIEQWKS